MIGVSDLIAQTVSEGRGCRTIKYGRLLGRLPAWPPAQTACYGVGKVKPGVDRVGEGGGRAEIYPVAVRRGRVCSTAYSEFQKQYLDAVPGNAFGRSANKNTKYAV